MKEIEIFDPAMCCSTGLCGPSIDTELFRISRVLNKFERSGILVKRHNLSSDPGIYLSNKKVNELIAKEGVEVLPITMVDGEIIKTKAYPTNEEFSQWTGIKIKIQIPIKKYKSDQENGCCQDNASCDCSTIDQGNDQKGSHNCC
jgi:hypothetical protein